MKKILVIDDSSSVHAFVKYCFHGFDVLIQSAYNGEEGLLFVKQEQANYDLILLDWEMPIKDGPSTLPEIMKYNSLQTVLMMTSKSSEENISQMINMGASEYIMKPFTKDIILGKTFPFLGFDYEIAN